MLHPLSSAAVYPYAFLCTCDYSAEFQSFATTHPEYAKLFTTYLELQRYQAIQEAMPGDLELAGQTSSGQKQEDSMSDKKDDWGRIQLKTLLICTERQNNIAIALKTKCSVTFSKLSYLPQQSHITFHVLVCL